MRLGARPAVQLDSLAFHDTPVHSTGWVSDIVILGKLCERCVQSWLSALASYTGQSSMDGFRSLALVLAPGNPKHVTCNVAFLFSIILQLQLLCISVGTDSRCNDGPIHR